MRVMTENEVRNLARNLASGARFSVPAGTILTPMARDFLRSRGIEIAEDSRGPHAAASGKGGDEALVEAVAAEVSRVLQGKGSAEAPPADKPMPLPPHQAGRHSANRAVVWAIGGDRPGILAAVAELLGARKVNIIEISQTVLSGVFAMVVIVDLSTLQGQFGELKAELEQLGKSLQINLSAQRDDIFQYMHRV